VARLPENRAGGVTAVTHDVALDSTYLFDRGPTGRYVGTPGTATLVDSARAFYLQPYDAILIKRQPEWQLHQIVTVQGEVRYPGDYALTHRDERLSDAIQHAGGLTSLAYPDGIVFVRRQGGVGRVGVDLPRILRDPAYKDNLQLIDGDSIFIPRFAPVVMVRGAVNSPVAVAYLPGASIDYYIRSAGGVSIQGDRGAAYVTQPSGIVETKRRILLTVTREPQPQPGSTVTVPNKDPAAQRDWVAIAASTTSLLGSLVAIAALLKR